MPLTHHDAASAASADCATAAAIAAATMIPAQDAAKEVGGNPYQTSALQTLVTQLGVLIPEVRDAAYSAFTSDDTKTMLLELATQASHTVGCCGVCLKALQAEGLEDKQGMWFGCGGGFDRKVWCLLNG